MKRLVNALLAGALVASCSSPSHPEKPLSPFGIAWSSWYGTLGTSTEEFLPQVRHLGAAFTKIYVIWDQLEPSPGTFDWKATDAYVAQLRAPEEGLIAVWSSSQWATRTPTAWLPPSPAKDPADYESFIQALVSRYRGKVRYWQNDAEPNNPLYWMGTREEFVDQLAVFHRAVKNADADAQVVVGGYDGMFGPPGSYPLPDQDKGLAFFDYVLDHGAASFDIFDMRLYADPLTIPARVAFMRQKMHDRGYDKPFICTEYSGPGFFEFPANLKYGTLFDLWRQSLADPAKGAELDKALADLHAGRSALPGETQMFMLDAPAELDGRLRRIQARDIVMRNVLALSAGVTRTLYWDLWHDTSRREDLLTLIYGKIKLMDYDEGGKLSHYYPQADAYARMTAHLDGVTVIDRVPTPDRPALYLFEGRRLDGPPTYVVWEQRDTFSGEDQPPVEVDLPWRFAGARASDVLGEDHEAHVEGEVLRLRISNTPVFVDPATR